MVNRVSKDHNTSIFRIEHTSLTIRKNIIKLFTRQHNLLNPQESLIVWLLFKYFKWYIKTAA